MVLQTFGYPYICSLLLDNRDSRNVGSQNMKMVSKEPTVIRRGGASLVNYKPLFSPDSRYLLCCCGTVVKVFSLSSGECVHQLIGHSEKVTAVRNNPNNKYQVYTSSLDGTICKWDYTDGILLKKHQLGFVLRGIIAMSGDGSTIIGIKTVTNNERNDLVEFSLGTQDKEAEVQTRTLLTWVEPHERFTSLGCQGKYIASGSGNSLKIFSIKKKRITEHRVKRQEVITCVECHPTDVCVATGLDTGQIILWFNITHIDRVVKTLLHWHALPLMGLCFTQSGSYILSGGHECVLLKWQYNSQHKDTLPRLGSPINHVACSNDNTLFATCHVDNSIQVINSNFTIHQVFQGLTRGQRGSDILPAGLHQDPRTRALVTNGRPGHLQFYSIHHEKQLYNLDIVGQNYISAMKLEKPLVLTQVEQVTFDPKGDWLVTVERRNDGKTSMEMKLKFWRYKTESQCFSLNTDVDLPHSDRVTALKFHPKNTMLVSTSKDKSFKIWSLVDDTDIYRENQCWSCESVGFYRDQPAHDADFSADGSILAVAFGMTLTLWDPDTNELQAMLPYCVTREPVRNVVFGRGDASHLLVSTTRTRLIVHNLLTMSVLWTVAIPVNLLIRDDSSSVMAAVTMENELIVFNPSKSQPVYRHSRLSSSPVVGGIFIQRFEQATSLPRELLWQQQVQLFMYNSQQELLTIGIEEPVKTRAEAVKLVQHQPETAFSSLLADQKLKEAASIQGNVQLQGLQGQPGSKVIKQLLSTPAHVLPPVASLCTTFLSSLMLRNTDNKRDDGDMSDDEDHKQNGTLASDSESDMEVDEPAQKPHVGQKMNIHKAKDDGKATRPNIDKPSKEEKFSLAMLSSLDGII